MCAESRLWMQLPKVRVICRVYQKPKRVMMKRIYQKSIDILQKSERLALQYSEKGFYLAFSGGKDSQCLYHIAKLAGVKFEAHYACTGIDHPELVRFIKRNYPDIVFDLPKISFWKLVIERRMLPTRQLRYCCEVLKETKGANTVTLTGVRRAESAKRSKRNIYEVSNRKFTSDSKETFDEWRKEQIAQITKNTNHDQFAEQGETEVRCINGKDKIIINPIIEWSDKDVWEFLNDVVKVEHCELYDRGYHRLGCLFCPMSSIKEQRKMERDYPKYKAQYLRTIRRLRQYRNDNNLPDYYTNMTDEDVFQWWLSKKNLKQWKAENFQQLKLNFDL